MGSLSIALLNTAQAQQVYTRALNVLQTNIANVNTPGYASQTPGFINLPFNPDAGLPGGLTFGPLQNTRSIYSEQAVQDQQGNLNQNQQLTSDLQRLNATFDLNSTSGIPSTLSKLFNSFSTLSVSPNDPLARQQVISSATTAAQAINTTAQNIGRATSETDNQTVDTVNAINTDVSQLQALNEQRRTSPLSAHDAGIDAQVYAKLEDLSQYVNVSSIAQPDGTVNVYLAGQTPLLVGTHSYSIQASPTQNSTAILNADNQDITSQITTGKLSALIQQRNTLLPGYQNDINSLAKTLADTVNGQLASGVDTTGAAPTVDLFTYDPVAGAATTLSVTNIKPEQIAAAQSASPGGNGNSLVLAQLATAKTVSGLNFSQFYGNIAARFGNDLSTAKQNTTSAQALLAQAQSYRSQQQGVSLDQQAVQVQQFQQSYQATGEMFRVLNGLMQTTIDMIR